jgi:hypothetical protein
LRTRPPVASAGNEGKARRKEKGCSRARWSSSVVLVYLVRLLGESKSPRRMIWQEQEVSDPRFARGLALATFCTSSRTSIRHQHSATELQKPISYSSTASRTASHRTLEVDALFELLALLNNPTIDLQLSQQLQGPASYPTLLAQQPAPSRSPLLLLRTFPSRFSATQSHHAGRDDLDVSRHSCRTTMRYSQRLFSRPQSRQAAVSSLFATRASQC